MLFRFYVVRSLELDRQTVGLHRWPRAARRAFIASKVRALADIQRGRPGRLQVGPVSFTARSALDVGSLQSCLSDVHNELICPGILDAAATPVIVDVGANVGQFTTALKAFVPGARILAFEPDPTVAAALADNARNLGEVRTIAAAAGESPGTLELYRHHVSLMSTLRPGAVETYDLENRVAVPVVRLDDATAELGPVDLVKIDVEGFEIEVLRGATALLGRTRYLLIELSLGREDSTATLEVLAHIHHVRPRARIVRMGRPLGNPNAPICQDVLIDLDPPVVSPIVP